MSAFYSAHVSTPSPLPKWTVLISGLLGAGVVAFLMWWPQPHLVSWSGLLALATKRVLLVFGVCYAILSVLCAIRRDTKTGERRFILRTSSHSLWLAPLALFIYENSVWAVALTALVAVFVTKSLRTLQQSSAPVTTEESPVLWSANMFDLPDLSLWFWQLSAAIGAALCAQTGAVAAFAVSPRSGALLVGISFVIWTWLFTGQVYARNQRTLADSPPRILLTMTLAIVFTAIGLTRYLHGAGGSAGHSIPWASLVRRVSLSSQRSEQTGHEQPTGESPSHFSEAYSGIVLWPEKQTYTKLIAPTPALVNTALARNQSEMLLDIPFNGVYWFFRAPDVGPPKGSREAHGSPEMFAMRSTDYHPMSMEAHQNFGSLISVDCCSRIEIAIRNADRYPESVFMELILTNNSSPGKPSQSLGKVMVKSTQRWRLYDDRPPVDETLSFAIPPNSAIRRFDEATVVFHLDARRAQFGAKMGVERFVLIPRGL